MKKRNKKTIKEFNIFTEKFKINELLPDEEYFKHNSDYGCKYEVYHFNTIINEWVFITWVKENEMDKCYKEAEEFIYDKDYYFLTCITE